MTAQETITEPGSFLTDKRFDCVYLLHQTVCAAFLKARAQAIGLLFLLVALIGSGAAARAADVFWLDNKVFLVGEILQGDSERFLYALAMRNRPPQMVVLRSPGGQMSEAYTIGRLVRRYRLATSAPTRPLDDFYCPESSGETLSAQGNCICASACAFVWFGGVMRFGSVGLHRSYFQSNDLSFNHYENALRESRQGVKDYLEEMRIPHWVEDAIFETSSKEITVIEAATPSLPFQPWEQNSIAIDPSFQEFALAKCGGEGTPVYKHMGCYIDALMAAQKEREDARWWDLVNQYFTDFPDLKKKPFFGYFDLQVQDITSSQEFWDDGWLYQLGRAHWRTAQKFPDIDAPEWWSDEPR